MVRKGGLEPPRYCYRQPLKLGDLLCCNELTRIQRTDLVQMCAGANASDDFIRTHSHTALVHSRASRRCGRPRYGLMEIPVGLQAHPELW